MKYVFQCIRVEVSILEDGQFVNKELSGGILEGLKKRFWAKKATKIKNNT